MTLNRKDQKTSWPTFFLFASSEGCPESVSRLPAEVPLFGPENAGLECFS